MKIEALQMNRIDEFVAFCKSHKSKVDESFLYDEDLLKFQPNQENPTYIALNEKNEMIAAASLIIDEYNRKGKRARFRIFFSEIDDIKIYRLLLEALQNHTIGIEKLFVFVPLVNEILISVIEDLQFSFERYAFLLVREDLPVSPVTLPDGFTMRALHPGDEEAWVTVRNAAFAKLTGSETPITTEMVTKMMNSQDYLDGGMLLLFDKDKPVGVVRGAKDEFEDEPIMNIGPLAVLPEYQGKGLGRQLLRASLQFAKNHNYKRTILSVNGDNERGKALYIQEGFKQVEGVVCYNYYL